MRLAAPIRIVTAVALGLLLSSACMFHRLRQDIRHLQRSVDYETEGRIIVAIGDLKEEPVELLDYFVMDRPGAFVFTVVERKGGALRPRERQARDERPGGGRARLVAVGVTGPTGWANLDHARAWHECC